MNVSSTPSAQAPTPAHKANGTSVRTREQADAQHDAGNGMGFMAMLQTFTDPDTESAPSSDQAADAIASTLQAAAPVPPAPIEASVVQRHADGATATAARASGQRTMPGPGAADVQSDAQASGIAPGDHAIRNAASADGGLTTRTLQMASSDSNDKALQFSHAAAQAAENAGTVADKGHAAKEIDASMLRPLVPAQASAGVVSMFEAGLAGLRTGPGARGIERGQDRHLSAHAAAGFVAWADAAPSGASHQSASPVYAPTASTPVPAAAVAQKMHYWVAGGVQNAELQLDAFGGGSVDVRIAVKGDEATVTFRSDQPQARQLLLEAMPQLKELLAGEGLVLSGGFVGGSAQDPGHGTGHSSDRPLANGRAGGARDAQVPAPTIATVRSSTASAVDLFV